MLLRDPKTNLLLVDEALLVLEKRTGVAAYDFDFEAHFECSHPYEMPDAAPLLLRIGAVRDYDATYAELVELGLTPVNDPAAFARATDLTVWYPLIEELTPRSQWWDEPPEAAEVADQYGWPVFVKGERQTNRHAASSIVRSAAEFERLADRWQRDPVLSWQKMVVREYLPLRPVSGDTGGKVPASFEFRTFWWRGQLVGAGPYWADFASYDWSADERQEALTVAGTAAERADVPFLVVDVAQTAEGRWVVIELNDGQESGYGGVPRYPLWLKIRESVV